MGSCNLDHSKDDVKKKLTEQKSFLPEQIANGLDETLSAEVTQESLNDIFHLLKKYDLASEDERREREDKLAVYI